MIESMISLTLTAVRYSGAGGPHAVMKTNRKVMGKNELGVGIKIMAAYTSHKFAFGQPVIPTHSNTTGSGHLMAVTITQLLLALTNLVATLRSRASYAPTVQCRFIAQLNTIADSAMLSLVEASALKDSG
jgi:hypothetical protein